MEVRATVSLHRSFAVVKGMTDEICANHFNLCPLLSPKIAMPSAGRV